MNFADELLQLAWDMEVLTAWRTEPNSTAVFVFMRFAAKHKKCPNELRETLVRLPPYRKSYAGKKARQDSITRFVAVIAPKANDLLWDGCENMQVLLNAWVQYNGDRQAQYLSKSREDKEMARINKRDYRTAVQMKRINIASQNNFKLSGQWSTCK